MAATRSQNLRTVRSLADKKDASDLRYPFEMLTDETDYLLINIVKYKPAGTVRGTTEVFVNKTDPTGQVTGGSRASQITKYTSTRSNRLYNTYDNNKQEDLGSIILPIPSNIQDGNSISFGPGSLDGLTASVLDYAYDTIRGSGDITSLQDLGPMVQKILTRGLDTIATGPALEYFTRNIASSAANLPFGGNLTASQLLARQTGNILNPNMELLFEGVNLRSFKFSFKITPRDDKESKAVKGIIKTLKRNMTPQAVGTLYLQTPNIFELTYMKGYGPHPFLHRFKKCALTDMSVNYTGEGTYATYGDATPVSMVLDLGFKELEPIYSTDYNDEGEDGYDEVIHGGVGF